MHSREVVMEKVLADFNKIKNIDSPFTELFSLLKRYESAPCGSAILAYTSEELRIIYQHINNAMEVLLQGLQGVAHLIGITSFDEKVVEVVNQLGFFISAISNLTEALNDLRSDTDYVLEKRGVSNMNSKLKKRYEENILEKTE